jgi:uncharacterized protein (DUF58 family)
MLTSRGWWFILCISVLLVLSVLCSQLLLIVLSLALVLWFVSEWLLFAIRCEVIVRRLHCRRTLHTDMGLTEVLWAGQPIDVRLSVSLIGSLDLSYVVLRERLPPGAVLHRGQIEVDGAISAESPLELTYRIEPRGAGRLLFVGPSLRLADLQGFFYRATSLTCTTDVRVLPPLVDQTGHPTAMKHQNQLPPPGSHRFRRPGSGSELLDLRDYQPGDPPRTIAWKVSARRGRLITKEFETEVPVRCTLLIDVSEGVRLGPPGGTALSRIVEIAASVAQAAASDRDLVGIALIDEKDCRRLLRPARGRRHLTEVLGLLADAAALAPGMGHADLNRLLPPAYALARSAYPNWLRSDVNAFPAWLPWLWPQPRSSTPPGRQLPYFSAKRSRLYRWRKQLAALLSVRYGLAPGGLALLLEDDLLCADYLQRFLVDHQEPLPLSLFDRDGRYLFASAGKVDVLARVLLQGVAKGRDNELFVLLADLLELADEIGPLLAATRVALARHHRVLVVCPWPSGIAPPSARLDLEDIPDTSDPEAALLGATALRLHRAYEMLRRAFTALGVPVLCAASGDTVTTILERLNRLRGTGALR